MDLFHMRRYTGDNEDDAGVAEAPEVIKQKASEAEILAELKNRIERKRKKKQEEQSDEKPTEAPEVVKKPKTEGEESEEKAGKKKRKKRKKKPDANDDDSDPSATGFTVLGEDLDKKKAKVRRVLPDWLANPDIVSVDYSEDQLPVEKMLGLDETTAAALKANGVSHFFPVQRQVIPRLLPKPEDPGANGGMYFRPHDVCVSAPTGSGKTLAFVVPIVQSLRGRVVPRVRALVILPVQDLATQVYKVFRVYAQGSGLQVKLLTGQKSFGQEQNELVRKGIVGHHHSLADIVVATPGRLVDHIQNTEGFSLQHLRYD